MLTSSPPRPTAAEIARRVAAGRRRDQIEAATDAAFGRWASLSEAARRHVGPPDAALVAAVATAERDYRIAVEAFEARIARR